MTNIQIQDLVKDLTTKTDSLVKATDGDDEARKIALASAKAVVDALEKPEEVIRFWAEVAFTQRTSLKLGVDLGIFHVLHDAQEPISSKDLAAKTKAEELLIIRLLRVLCSFGIVKEAGVQLYLPTPYSEVLTRPGFEGAVTTIHDYETTSDLPPFFKERSYVCPTDKRDCPFQFGKSTKLTYFEYIHQSKAGIKAFTDFMGTIRSTRRFWLDWYDASTILFNDSGVADGDVLMVDLGGGAGHDLTKFVTRFPEAQGKLILQDLGTTISPIQKDLHKGIKGMAHDFFTPQPIKGAKAYYMHFCLHDWSDDDCKVILRHILEAMKPGYSKLLLNEAIVPDLNCDPWFAATDFNLMAILGSLQRSESHWIELLESVGFSDIKISRSPFEGDNEGIIEASL